MMNDIRLWWSRRGTGSTPVFLVLLVALLTSQKSGAQTYSKGQSISPAFEGWERNPDGSMVFLFGYMNRNWEEEINLPVGPNNSIEPGGPDQGQPTRFFPRRNRFIFRVPVPKDFGQKEMIWTLTANGKTERAYATLKPDFFVDDQVIASENGSIGAGITTPESRANKRPILKVEGEKQRTAKAGQPLTVVASVTDDGVPRPFFGRGAPPAPAGRTGGPPTSAPAAGAPAPGAPPSGAPPSGAPAPGAAPGGAAGAGGQGAVAPPSPSPFGRGNPAMNPPTQVTVGKTVGLYMGWFVYRGAGKVTFSPDQIKMWEDTRVGGNSPWSPLWVAPPAPKDGRWSTQMTFDQPGTYVLRARADDGALYVDEDLTITVTR